MGKIFSVIFSCKDKEKGLIERDSYLWNFFAGFLNAFQSVIILMVITRVLDLESAGIFTIAYATSNLFLTIGKFGMRNFQVTDAQTKYSFKTYQKSRIVTCIAMFLVTIGYVLYMMWRGGYQWDKALIVFFMCLLKLIDAIEDIYHGLYQQNNRLDMASELLAKRMALTIVVFVISLLLVRSLLPSLIITFIISGIYCLFSLLYCNRFFILENSVKKETSNPLIGLLKDNFSLFASSFLIFYIGNAPKYAIDANLNNELQACYGFIAMPVFVVSLLNAFLYQPILSRLAVEWTEKEYGIFLKEITKQCIYIFGLTLITIIGGNLCGIPVLSWIYATDLTNYKTEMLILLAGGGALALSGFLSVVLTIIRTQNCIVLGNLIVGLFAFLLSPVFVTNYGVMGAAVVYLILMLALNVILLFFSYKQIRINLNL